MFYHPDAIYSNFYLSGPQNLRFLVITTAQPSITSHKRQLHYANDTQVPTVILFRNRTFWKINDPVFHKPLIYDIPSSPSIYMPEVPSRIHLELPSLIHQKEVQVLDDIIEEEIHCSSLIKKRRKKMNKHKYKKRIHRDIAKIRKIRVFRMRKKRGRQAHKKRLLLKKLDKVLKKNPKSDLPNRPYVVYRLKNW